MMSMISCSIFRTSKTCSASKNLALKCFDSSVYKCLIELLCSILCPKVLHMHKYLIVIHYSLPDANNGCIILKQKVRYLDPVVICESLHPRPSWMKYDDDFLKLFEML